MLVYSMSLASCLYVVHLYVYVYMYHVSTFLYVVCLFIFMSLCSGCSTSLYLHLCMWYISIYMPEYSISSSIRLYVCVSIYMPGLHEAYHIVKKKITAIKHKFFFLHVIRQNYEPIKMVIMTCKTGQQIRF